MSGSTTTYTQENLDAIDMAIAKGVTRVKFSTGMGQSQEVEYRDLDSMLKIRELIYKALNPATEKKSLRFARFDRWVK